MAKKRAKKARYPTKATLNLAMRERRVNSPRVMLPLLLLIAVFVGVFAKFAVVDVLAGAGAGRAALMGMQAQLEQIRQANSEYDDVLGEYNRYFSAALAEEEVALADRADVLDLIHNKLMPRAQTSEAALTGNTLTVTVSGLTLRELSDLMYALKGEELVVDVTIASAGTGSDDGGGLNAVAMAIELTGEKGGAAP